MLKGRRATIADLNKYHKEVNKYQKEVNKYHKEVNNPQQLEFQ